MQVSVEVTSGLERRLTMGVPAEKLDNVVNERLAKAQKNLRLPGFRPGKVPMGEVRRRFGKEVRLEAMGELMQQSFFEAVEQDRKSTRLNSSHVSISYAVFCLKNKKSPLDVKRTIVL